MGIVGYVPSFFGMAPLHARQFSNAGVEVTVVFKTDENYVVSIMLLWLVPDGYCAARRFMGVHRGRLFSYRA